MSVYVYIHLYAERCVYTPLCTYTGIAKNVYSVRNKHATWNCGLRPGACVPPVSCVPVCLGKVWPIGSSRTPVQACSECIAPPQQQELLGIQWILVYDIAARVLGEMT